jgi:type IV secretory pathway VirB10-like protein
LGDPIAAEEPIAATLEPVVAEPVEAQPAQVKGADFLGEQQSLLTAQEDEERRKKAAEEFIAEPLTDVEGEAAEEKVISDVPPTTFLYGGAAEVTPSPPSPAKQEEEPEEPPSPAILTQEFSGEMTGGGGGGMSPPKAGFTREKLIKLLKILAKGNPTLDKELERILVRDRQNISQRGAVQTLAKQMGIDTTGAGRGIDIPMDAKDLASKIKKSGKIGRDIRVEEWNDASKGGENRLERLQALAIEYDIDINY